MDPSAPGVLAEQLADAKAEAEAKITEARAALAEARQDVIQRGTTRMREIAELQAELAAEQTALDQVVSKA